MSADDSHRWENITWALEQEYEWIERWTGNPDGSATLVRYHRDGNGKPARTVEIHAKDCKCPFCLGFVLAAPGVP